MTIHEKLELIGETKSFPLCHSKECGLRSECANHATAGDFRTEDGETPNLFMDAERNIFCDRTTDGGAQGAMLLVNGNLNRYDWFNHIPL